MTRNSKQQDPAIAGVPVKGTLYYHILLEFGYHDILQFLRNSEQIDWVKHGQADSVPTLFVAEVPADLVSKAQQDISHAHIHPSNLC